MRVRKKPLTTDTIIAIAATVTSLCALLITVYQTVLTREQQLNSVWPYLIISTNVDDKGKAVIVVTNNGIGPAIVEKVSIHYKGQPYKNMVEVVQAMSMQLGRGPNGITWVNTDIGKGFVLPQGQAFEWISAYNATDYAIFQKELDNLDAVIHFKSIYGERWRSSYHPHEEDAVVKE